MEIMTKLSMLKLIIFFFFLFFSEKAFSGPKNIALFATVTSSSNLNDHYDAKNAIDGIIRIGEKGEWACEGSGTFGDISDTLGFSLIGIPLKTLIKSFYMIGHH